MKAFTAIFILSYLVNDVLYGLLKEVVRNKYRSNKNYFICTNTTKEWLSTLISNIKIIK